MCGILGYVSLTAVPVDRSVFAEALLSLSHRGPDCQRTEFFDDGCIAFGHTRLSIIDLHMNASQPMRVRDVWVVFNGEIYNYIELREELRKQGFEFRTNGDTEVLAAAYLLWGEACVNRFNGMWSFAIYDAQSGVVFCSRDRYGVKPFNYSLTSGRFIFSSEVKALLHIDSQLRKPNYNSIALFCNEGVCGEIDDTWFEGVKRLPPGCNMVIRGGVAEISRYYDYPSEVNDDITFDEASKRYRDLFLDALRLRMRSDVPVGLTLSGGLDSTSIAGGVRSFFSGDLCSFTAGFEQFADDESSMARKTAAALKLNDTIVDCTYDGGEYINVLRQIVYHLESGHLSPSVFPLWRLYEVASRHVTVVLEGQGADEHLAGYIESCAGVYIEHCIRSFEFFKAIRSAADLARNYSLKNILLLYVRTRLPVLGRRIAQRLYLQNHKILCGPLKACVHPCVFTSRSSSFFASKLQYAHRTTLANLLHYGDAISMAFAMESRLPYMDYRLVDFAMTLPADFFIRNGVGKALQRDALRDYIGDDVRTGVKKKGFPSPIADFLASNRDLVKGLLLSNRAAGRGLFHMENLSRLLDAHGKDWERNHRFIFRLICVELWFEVYMDSAVSEK